METVTGLSPATKWAWDTDITADVRGFMIVDDKKFSVILNNGERANFPAGTFTVKQRYDVQIRRILQTPSELDRKSIWIFYNQ